MRLTDFQVLGLDCYGTLIDWETGISEACPPGPPPAGRTFPETKCWPPQARQPLAVAPRRTNCQVTTVSIQPRPLIQPRDKSAKITKGLQRSAQPLGFLVAGAGFEPATFGL